MSTTESKQVELVKNDAAAKVDEVAKLVKEVEVAKHVAVVNVDAVTKVVNKVEVAGFLTGVDGRVRLDPAYARSLWGMWMERKRRKEGQESVDIYFMEKQRMRAEEMERTALKEAAKCKWRKPQKKKNKAKPKGKAKGVADKQGSGHGKHVANTRPGVKAVANPNEQSSISKASPKSDPPKQRRRVPTPVERPMADAARSKDTSTQKRDNTAMAIADRKGSTTVDPALLRSRWGQWVAGRMGDEAKEGSGKRVREGRENWFKLCMKTAKFRSNWRAQLEEEKRQEKRKRYMEKTKAAAQLDVSKVVVVTTKGCMHTAAAVKGAPSKETHDAIVAEYSETKGCVRR